MFWDDAAHPIERISFSQLLEWHAKMERSAAVALRRRAAAMVIDAGNAVAELARRKLIKTAEQCEATAARWHARAEAEK